LKAEEKRLEEARRREKDWKLWGCYVSERAWGTVREDYSADVAVNGIERCFGRFKKLFLI
jgi:hypothetical protein